MKQENWEGEFDKHFRPIYKRSFTENETVQMPSDYLDWVLALDKIKIFTADLLSKKDQEHRESLERIKGEILSEKVGYEHDRQRITGSYGKTVAGVQRDTMEQAISIIQSHINKLSTE